MKYIYPIKKLFYLSKKFSDLVAVDQEDQSYSYNDFTNMTINLSKKILAVNKRPTVVIIGEKNILSYVSMFAVLLSGGTYIPISSKLPINRMIKIISSTKVDIIICQKKNLVILKKKFNNKTILTEEVLLKKNSAHPKVTKINKLAYIIFSYGSTGEPKGVCISRK